MVKIHTIKLDVTNETPFMMTYVTHWFDSGRVADNFEWPKSIKGKGEHTIVCYERDWSMAGCSGYVQYVMNGNTITIAFSNPSAGNNKVGIGIGKDGKSVWEGISSHDYQEFKQTVDCGGVDISAYCLCTGGTTNTATVRFHCETPTFVAPGYKYSS